MKIIVLLCLCFTVSACSNKAVYQDLQRNKRNECLQVPQSEYDRCMQNMQQSYEEYERQRQQALKDPTETQQEK